MRLFAATLATETNTFSPLPTGLASYKESVFFRPNEHPDDAPRMCTAPLFVARGRAGKDGFTLVEHVRKQRGGAEVPVLFLTRRTERAAVDRGFALGAVDYISSAGLRVLLMTVKRLRGNGGQLVLGGLNASVRQIFELAGFLSIFTVETDVDRAVARATGAAGGA